MGLDDRLVRELLPSIVEYADLGQFIDAPIKTYSSGMRARLGFAIATSVDPDILLLDEVLATGDAEFREKSKARVIELVKAAKGIVLVTHDMAWVEEYCNRAMLLEQGRVIIEGDPSEVVRTHIERSQGAQGGAGRAARLGRRSERRRPAGEDADRAQPSAAAVAPPAGPPAVGHPGGRGRRSPPATRTARSTLTDAISASSPDDRDGARRPAPGVRGPRRPEPRGRDASRHCAGRAGGDAFDDAERRLHGDLAETDARWRPRVRRPAPPPSSRGPTASSCTCSRSRGRSARPASRCAATTTCSPSGPPAGIRSS